jgi:Tfp pilus assembly protein PilX
MRRARDEDGFAVVAAVVLLTVILGLGLGLLLFTDNQQKASTHEQASEAAFNVAEAALNAQVGQLSRKWPRPGTAPATETSEMPGSCTAGTSTETNDCPSATDLKLDPNTSSTTCSGTDAWGSSLSNQWTTYVRQDPSESPFFNSTEEKIKPTYPEQTETGALWVRSVGVVQCHAVTVVSLVTRLRVTLKFPIDAVVGNWFKVTNKGNKALVNRTGNASEPAAVSMRCEGKASLAECEEYEESKEQVSPPLGGEDPKSTTATLTASELETLKAEAQAYKTFYSPTSPYHCPTSMTELEGVKLASNARAPVYVEGCGTLNIKANGEANCIESELTEPKSPGFLVIANGTFEMSGKSRYCGVIYAANLNTAPLNKEAIVRLQGGAVVVGGIVVDGAGGIEFGSSGQGGNPSNLTYDSLAIHDLTISAGAASTRNSFRILPSGQ